MKLTRLLLLMALMPGISIAQKAKINDLNLSSSYTVYPEIGGF